MKKQWKRIAETVLGLCLIFSVAMPAGAAVSYMPDVTGEMSAPDFWADLEKEPDRVLMTWEEIAAQNADTAQRPGTHITDLKNAAETFDGITQSKSLKAAAEADAKYYYGWIYGTDGQLADWSYFQRMINNCADPDARKNQKVRYGIAVNRTTLQVFPSDQPLWDDPADPDFNYYSVSGIRVNEPMLIYGTSTDGRYYLAVISCCSGWVPVEDVALCRNKAEWLDAWDFPAEETLVVYGNKVYTDASNSHPETARRMLTLATKLHSVDPDTVEELVNNRSAYHNYIVELPVRTKNGYYEKALALIPETAKVSEGFLPLTKRNIAMVALSSLGDAYGWGGMMEVEDCSGLVRLIYECFGLDVPRNGTWQPLMNIEAVSMSDMSLEEKCQLLDQLPLGTALCFSGHEMMYLGKYEGKYYVYSTVSSMMDPSDPSRRLRVRDVVINTLDVRRANGRTWMEEVNSAFMIGYGKACGQTWEFPQQQWYHDGVAWCEQNGILSAKADGSFGIGDTVSRADAAEALWHMAGNPVVNYAMRFEDVEQDAVYAEAVRWAAAEGIINGYSDTVFAPEEPVTREQLAVLLQGLAQRQGAACTEGSGTALNGFPDAAKADKCAAPALEWAVRSGLIGGTGEGLLEPKGLCTRAQLAVILLRYSQQSAT